MVALSHRFHIDVPFSLVRLKYSLQGARGGAISDFQKTATLLFSDRSHVTGHKNRVDGSGSRGLLGKNRCDVSIF